jgi:prepilin-type N-terminal cleavage/methylation domain-containing protein
MPDIKHVATNERGFSLVEMMVSSTVMLLVLAEAMTAFNQAFRAEETVTLIADSNQVLRAGTAFMVRDLLQAGWGDETLGRGVPIPTGTGSELVNRPSPPGTAYTFDDSLGVIPAVTPGAGLGPNISGVATDIITILYVDNQSPLDHTAVNMSNDGASMTVPNGTSITDPDNAIVRGDLILFTNALGSAVQEVTRTQGQIVYFETTDVSNLNQRGAEAGTIIQLQATAGVFSAGEVSATRIKMISYFLDKDSDPSAPRLVRQENFRTPRAMAGAMDDLQMTYDLVDGVTNPTNVENPVDPSPNQIRKVNLDVGVRSEGRSMPQNKYARNRISTQISLRSLAFVDRYE